MTGVEGATAVDLIPWVIVGIMGAAFVAVLAIGVVAAGRFLLGLVDDLGDQRQALIAAQAMQLEDTTQSLARITTTFTDAMAKLASATAGFIAPDVNLVQPEAAANPVAIPSRVDLAAMYAEQYPATGLPDGEQYVDWTDDLIPDDPDARARFIPPGATPLDVIKGPRGEG